MMHGALIKFPCPRQFFKPAPFFSMFDPSFWLVSLQLCPTAWRQTLPSSLSFSFSFFNRILYAAGPRGWCVHNSSPDLSRGWRRAARALLCRCAVEPCGILCALSLEALGSPPHERQFMNLIKTNFFQPQEEKRLEKFSKHSKPSLTSCILHFEARSLALNW